MNLLAILFAAAMATATPHAHSMMHSSAMHSSAMHRHMQSHSAMHTHMMAKPTPKP